MAKSHLTKKRRIADLIKIFEQQSKMRRKPKEKSNHQTLIWAKKKKHYLMCVSLGIPTTFEL